MSRSSYSPSGRSSYRRPHVKCANPDCNKETIKFQHSGNGKYSMYCGRHSCHSGYGCKTMTERGEKFCSYHGQCSHPGCGKRALQEDDDFKYSKMKAATPSQDWWFCSDRKTHIYLGTNRATDLAQIVARPKTAGDIVAVPRDLHFVLSTSVMCRPVSEGETLVGLLTPGIATNIGAAS
ncbi:uncharacterized protein FIESC28_00892 [Fusarium coffeatum]|uniref:Uncharacterized protein n=1 Tax=Fusarium coffeatum TaxID=231269 RepID=A0A366SA92_9HYPO|nr:uncharacterized protein FIESC28_00892 [Fusarium coffeatum]RBR26247.1 hypothetical protein FIESC28_00892 [Fusarium coffeatum]